MNPAAVNYNPLATNQIPENICQFAIPFQTNWVSGQFGTHLTSINPEPSSEEHALSEQWKVDITEDEVMYNRKIRFWDYV